MARKGVSGSTPGARRLAGLETESIAQALSTQQSAGLAAWAALAEALSQTQRQREVDEAGQAVVSALAAGGTLLVCGNGGSAAIASHIAAELVGKCIHDRDPLPAVNLSESLASVTAIANDYAYDHVFARGVRAHGKPGDVLLAMSTSGNSPNVLRALESGREIGLTIVLLTGARGEHLTAAADHVLAVPSTDTPRIQEVHMLWAHAWCEAIDILCHGPA